MNTLLNPIRKIVGNPYLLALIAFSVFLFILFYFLGKWLLPLTISVVIAYFLDGIIKKIEKIQIKQYQIKRSIAFPLVYFLFILAISYLIIVMIPIIYNQAKALINNAPYYFNAAQNKLIILQEKFPSLFKKEDITNLMQYINNSISSYGKELITSNKIFASFIALTTLTVFLVLIPVLVFFLLKDKDSILTWLSRFLPKNRQSIYDVWKEIDKQIGNYIRGKIIEILVIWFLNYICFAYLGLQYSLLLSLLVGLSTLIPFVGATLVTFPVLLVGYIQFDLTSHFYWLTFFYFLLQILDGNVIVPIIFSEVVSINPVAIIAAILIFGGLWGILGVFLAIPLATVVKAILETWWYYQDK